MIEVNQRSKRRGCFYPNSFQTLSSLTGLPILGRDVPNISGYRRLVHIEPRIWNQCPRQAAYSNRCLACKFLSFNRKRDPNFYVGVQGANFHNRIKIVTWYTWKSVLDLRPRLKARCVEHHLFQTLPSLNHRSGLSAEDRSEKVYTTLLFMFPL